MASRDMLEEDFGISLPLDKIYRMMDKLEDKAIRRLKDITYQNTLNLLGARNGAIWTAKIKTSGHTKLSNLDTQIKTSEHQELPIWTHPMAA
jgi:hypothetical protein